MLKAEAKWIAHALVADASDGGVVLNLGSSGRAFREEIQPWIEALVCSPLRARGQRMVHQDLIAQDGVDVSGDLTDPAVRESLAGLGVSAVLCCNMLEHVPDPKAMATLVAGLVPPGGHLVCTVPRAFPYHPDPIDTLFRPTPVELVALFPGFRVLGAADVACGSMLAYVLANPTHLLRRLFALGSGSFRSSRPSGASARDFLPWLLRELRVSCVHLVRPSGDTVARSHR